MPKRSKRRWISALITGAALVVVVVASACGGSDTTTTGGGAPPASTSAGTSQGTTSASGGATGGGTAQLPNPCTLLTLDEVHTILSDVKAAEPPGSNTSGPIKSAECKWLQEPTEGSFDFNKIGDIKLTITTGYPPGQMKLSLQSEAQKNGRVIDGLGDFGFVQSQVNVSAEVKVLKGDRLIDIELTLAGARDKQDAFVALARAAVGRL